MKRKKKFSKGTGHVIVCALLIAFIMMLILSKIIGMDSKSEYEFLKWVTYLVVLAIGIEFGMEITIREDNP